MRWHRNENGAVIIHVAIALVALLAFSAFVVDQGVMYVARRQAQNAADAGALAGAVSLVKDGGAPTDAGQSALHWAGDNAILGAANSASNSDITLSGPSGTCGTACTVAPIPPCGDKPGCVRVDVFRNMPDRTNATRGSAIPTFFGHLIGVSQQGVRATATAWTATANSATCLKPWAVADKWAEFRNGATGAWPGGQKPWEPTDTFDKWTGNGTNVALYPDPRDSYVPPTDTITGTGFTPDADFGRQLILKAGSASDPISAGWFQALQLPCASDNSGASCYRENIYGCTTMTYSIGDTIQVDNKTGNMVGPTEQGVNGGGPVPVGQALVQQDPDAKWKATGPYVPGQPQPGFVEGGKGMNSPRIVPVALIDIDDYLSTSPSGKSTVKIVNIMGFFVEGTCGSKTEPILESYNDCSKNNSAVVGRLVRAIGLQVGSGPVVGPDSSFLKVIQLVR